MRIRHILFDLDGTLLPMNQDEFVKFYLPLLAKAYVEAGMEIDPKKLVGAVWTGYEAMVNNDGSRTNKEAFWSCFQNLIPIEREAAERISLAFYDGEFNRAVCTTSPTPVADRIVKAAKKKGIETYLATNPVFPRPATMNRIRWAGLSAADFKVITTYEDYSFCKPNPEYFRVILERFGLEPEECLMVGNDAEEDLAIRKLGVKTFLVTDTLENKKNLPLDTEYMGTLEELLEFVGNLEDCRTSIAGGREL